MRVVVWTLTGCIFGARAWRLAVRDVSSLRARGATFAECHATDAPITPFVSALAGGALWWSLSLRFDSDVAVVVLGLWSAALLRLVSIDVDTHVLPRRTTIVATVSTAAGLCGATVFGAGGDVTSMIWGGCIMWVVMRVLEFASRGDLGGGDVTLAPLLGIAAGWQSLDRVLTVIIVAFGLAGVVAVVLLAIGRVHRRSFLAFGPFLVVGGFVAVLR